MLDLNPPFHIIDGVAVFADHAGSQFYYLPATPHLSVVDGVPQIQLLEFTAAAGGDGGGFLTFTVDLGVSEALLDGVRAQVKRLFGVQGRPALAPVVLEDGTVRLSALGTRGPDGEPGEPPAPDTPPAQFVLDIDQPAHPALYGANEAIFSVRLDEHGTTLVKRSLEGTLMPIGIVYELEFLGLRPAFNVHVHVDWERVQQHLEKLAQTRVVFLSTEVDKIVDELHEKTLIDIQVDNFVPEGEDAGRVISDPKKVLDQVKDMVFQTFFQSTLNPAGKGVGGQIVDVAAKISTLAASHGWAGIAAATFKKVDLTRIDSKLLDFNLRERTTVRRRIYPQAHLQGLAAEIAGGLDLASVIRSASLDDPFFRHRRVKVVNRADLAADDIASIKASLRYGDDHRSVTLDTRTPEQLVDWTSIVAGGAVVPDVEIAYTVSFGNVDSADRPAALTAAPRTIQDDGFDVSPRADGLYHVVNVPVTALSFPWARYPQVQVDLRYVDATNAISLDDTLILDKATESKSWKWFRRDVAKDAFEYRMTFRAADHRDWSLDWRSTRDEHVLVRDPRPAARSVTIVAAVQWSAVQQVFVDVSYRDDANGVRAEQSFAFSQVSMASQTFSVALQDPDRRIVRYEAKILFADNSLVELPASTTLQNQIIVRADMRGHRVVTVRPAQVDFAAANVREVKATLRYRDDDSELDFAGDFTFASADVVAFFEFDFVDVRKRAFTLDSRTIFKDGFVARHPQQTIDADDVSLTVA